MLLNLKDLSKQYNLQINSVLHVGAHKCEELSIYNNLNIKNQNIIWIDAILELVDSMKKKDSSIRIYNYLVTDLDDAEYDFNIASNGESSSIYEFGTHQHNYPQIKYIEKRTVKSKRLDTIFKLENIDLKIDFLNLDIQGAELLALKSLGNILNDIKYIYTEVNTEHVYKNCALITEIDQYLKQFGFERTKTHIVNNKVCWGDALYIRK